MDKAQAGLSLPGEPEDKCCWCIPIKIGVIILGIGVVAQAALSVLGGLGVLSTYFIAGVVMCAAAAPLLLAAFWYIKWFQDMESKETREGTAKAMMMVALSALINLAGLLLEVIIYSVPFSALISGIITTGITIVIVLYYVGVCKRFASQA